MPACQARTSRSSAGRNSGETLPERARPVGEQRTAGGPHPPRVDGPLGGALGSRAHQRLEAALQRLLDGVRRLLPAGEERRHPVHEPPDPLLAGCG